MQRAHPITFLQHELHRPIVREGGCKGGDQSGQRDVEDEVQPGGGRDNDEVREELLVR